MADVVQWAQVRRRMATMKGFRSIGGTVQGIIFDMDNTLLQSRIDFPSMKKETYEYLLEQRLLQEPFPLEEHTCATLIEHAKRQGAEEEQVRRIMDIATKHELEGMADAGLEPGVVELLEMLQGRYLLAIVTNNAYPAAVRALEATSIAHCFDLIVGREQMTALKPSPSGYELVLSRFGKVPPKAWLSVGDSWIDGKGSETAGIRFVSYRTSMETMRKRGVQPVGCIEDLGQLINYLR
ncbi:HAD family hydrolase [Paenibacillus sp. GD4]|uniref:HAD family hydrolase n=1 Tax=Paenibacillus sp. GD4 TaxID=3068890 RepID=UPI00279685F7|nr:HAD family hydrolase [Paenibacillus sp. GD4]MDQ1910432.1 HAD family hydrolase [Paenibacillus sp. GD4]